VGKPRGTTLRVRFDPHPGRSQPWGVFWNVYQPGRTGRPKQKSAWFTTEAEAEEFKRLTLVDLAKTAPASASEPTIHRHVDSLAAMAVDWLKHVEDQREAATHKSYKELVKNYLAPGPTQPHYPALGDLIVSNATMTPKTIADYLTTLHQAGVSLSMRRRLHRALSAFCTYAKFAGRLTGHNPCFDLGRLIRRRGEEESEPTPNPFTQDEIARIFDQLEACEPTWVPFFQFLYDTGVRPGEAAALKWEELDFERLMVRVALNWSPAAKADKLPKTHERRRIDLTQLVADQLLAWRPVQRQELLRRGIPQTPYVFTSRRGCRRLQDGHVRLVFGRVMKACGITGHSLYDFRDSFASHHLADDWFRKLGWVSHQLGHKHVSTTERYYYAYRPTTASRGFADEIRGVK
jgi:integrase